MSYNRAGPGPAGSGLQDQLALADGLAELEGMGLPQWRLSRGPLGYVMSARPYARQGVRWRRAVGSTPLDAVDRLLRGLRRPDASPRERTSLCSRCHEAIQYAEGRGWTHGDGGRFMLACEVCGHRGAFDPVPDSCPRCGAVERWKLHHDAVPPAAH